MANAQERIQAERLARESANRGAMTGRRGLCDCEPARLVNRGIISRVRSAIS